MSSPLGFGEREGVLQLLRDHLAQELDAHERSMAEEILRFVEREPRCAERSTVEGHLTGSAWIVDPTGRLTLLTHHRKLNKWLQLGGHADGDLDLLAVAVKEAQEESGLMRLRVLSPRLFDVDRHWIPPRKQEPGHWHYDLRFLLAADAQEAVVLTDESHELAWIEISRMAEYNPEESMMRMARKTLVRAPGDR